MECAPKDEGVVHRDGQLDVTEVPRAVRVQQPARRAPAQGTDSSLEMMRRVILVSGLPGRAKAMVQRGDVAAQHMTTADVDIITAGDGSTVPTTCCERRGSNLTVG